MTNTMLTPRDEAINRFLARSYAATLDQAVLIFFREPWRSLDEFGQYHGTGANRIRALAQAGFVGRHSCPVPVLGIQLCLFAKEKWLYAVCR